MFFLGFLFGAAALAGVVYLADYLGFVTLTVHKDKF